MSSLLPLVPFYFLRHGITDHNRNRLVMGQLDIPLNMAGRRQARQAAELAASLGIVRIVSSPLTRARETAAIIASFLGLPVIVENGFKERDWGTMEGRSYRELIDLDRVPEGAESFEAFSSRAIAALPAALLPAPALLVAHSGLCRVLRHHLSISDNLHSVPNAVPIRFSPDSSGRWSECEVTLAALRQAKAKGETNFP